ncbi:methyltransferase domain-containing protein [Streptomyces shenzhenensis]|uniref:2-ketoarginine methyltransferase n=1 Tax=Streptomyces shenzhenensis TaxID=943815 RepID=A0A3M0I257_9ACTN|nr:methyltransferase domain-containing protein [Streptomyces shenzhenensis]RMB82885.1 2-ketoarginine methyltransferase [Streptomyces shenzhenensis]
MNNPAVETDFEHRLVEAIQPIRHLALAHALYTMLDNGVYQTVKAEPGLTSAAIAERHGLDAERFAGLCLYLANEGYFAQRAKGAQEGWHLTEKAKALEPFQPWYTLLVGGYAQTFGQLGEVLKHGAPFATRDGAKVGAGSCGMSMFDALPLADRLLNTLPAQDLTVVDLGCGDAAFLTELVRRRPGLRAVGIEPDEVGSRLAEERVEAEGLSDRVTIHRGRAADAVSVELPTDGTLCFLTAFVLQEMLEQESEAAVTELLRKTMNTYPGAYWLVIEVDQQLDDPRTMSHALGLSYYNPYFLLHVITEQRLEKRAFWDDLFDRAQLDVVDFAHPDASVDSTALELGYLLRRREPAPQHV